MLLSRHRKSLSFSRIPLALILLAMSSLQNLNAETAMELNSNKTPLRYYTTKQKGYSTEFIQNYLGAKISSASQLDQKVPPLKQFALGRPIIPFQPLIIDMPFDLVLGVEDGDFSMIELIKIPASKPGQSDLWFILESTFKGKQYIGLPADQKDAQEIIQIAKLLSFETYPSELKVDTKLSGDSLLIEAVYKRKVLNNNKKIEFMAEVPLNLLPDLQGQTNNQLQPAANKRLSHGMNHSAASVLALIDIYQTPDFLKLKKIKVSFKKTSQVKLQKILGIGVSNPLSQLVMGLGTRSTTAQIFNQELVEVVPGKFAQALSDRMGRVEYSFDTVVTQNVNGQEIIRQELREIQLFTNDSNTPKGKILFNPSLPDLRFQLPSGVHSIRVAMSLNGLNQFPIEKEEMLNAYVGEIRIQNSNTGRGVMLELRAGDMDTDHRERFKKTPEWTYKRPYFSMIEYDKKSLDATINCGTLSPATEKIFTELMVLSPVHSLQSIQNSQIDWIIRPHRLSRLVVRTSDKTVLEHKQREIDSTMTADAPAYMLGGTWGNGAAASDLTVSAFTQGLIAPKNEVKVYQVTTPMFPMRQELKNYEENHAYFTGEKAEIVAHALLKIKFEGGIVPGTIIPFINGVKFQSAANHVETAVTFNSLAFRLLSAEESLNRFGHNSMKMDSEGYYNLMVEIKKGFGPELTRPYRGPWRQNLESYSGYGALDIGIIVSEENSALRPFTVAGAKKFPVRFKLPGKIEHRSPTFSEQSINPRFFPTSLEVQSLAPSQQMRASRYVRSLSLAMPMDQSPRENWSFVMDNEGEISWKTEYAWKIEGLESNLFQ